MLSFTLEVQQYVEFEGGIALSDHEHDQKDIQLLNLAYGPSILEVLNYKNNLAFIS